MLQRQTLRGFVFLLSALPMTMANSFINTPGVVRGNIIGSAALEWTLQSEPGRDYAVGFTFKDADVFRYTPYTGVIPPPILDGNSGYPQYSNASYDHRFTIYNTSTRGVGFQLAGLKPEDAGTYTCRYETLGAPITMEAVLFVYDVPGRPDIEASPQILVEGVTTASIECGAFSTSLPVADRPAMLYTWSRNGVEIDRTGPPERHAVLGDSGQFLEISPVHHTDITYTCRVSESGTQLTSEETEVTLDILHGPYNLKTNPEKPSARESASLEITASAECNPACDFMWSIGDDVISQGTRLRFGKFQARDANNYTLRAVNLYGTADLTAEVTLDTSPGTYTVPGENEFWTTDSAVEDTRDAQWEQESGGSFIVIVASAVACGVVLIIIVIVVTVVVCVRRKRKLASEYVNSDVFREPGQTASDYVNSEVFSEPTSAGHQSPEVSGHYESMDMATRESADPINRVYASLQQ